ncbi:MAG TPA: hypothetical protein VK525_09475 [Candidatus Saccharimonadales bacterium]|nr:hypothetical protein [Candidatus Saccharimonadales bacterium]
MPINPDAVRHRFDAVAKDLLAFAESIQSHHHIIIPQKWTTTPAELLAAEGLVNIFEQHVATSKSLIEITAKTAKASTEVVAGKSASQGA